MAGGHSSPSVLRVREGDGTTRLTMGQEIVMEAVLKIVGEFLRSLQEAPRFSLKSEPEIQHYKTNNSGKLPAVASASQSPRASPLGSSCGLGRSASRRMKTMLCGSGRSAGAKITSAPSSTQAPIGAAQKNFVWVLVSLVPPSSGTTLRASLRTMHPPRRCQTCSGACTLPTSEGPARVQPLHVRPAG